MFSDKGSKKGEIAELREELNHPDKTRKKEAVKKGAAGSRRGSCTLALGWRR